MRHRTTRHALLSTATAVLVGSLTVFGQSASVVTHRNDPGRSGANLNETVLNTSTVQAGKFGMLFTRPVNGLIFAQPLYQPAVNMGANGTHNVVFVATEMNNVYAFDADDPTASTPLWQLNLGTPVPASETGEPSDIPGVIGITGTPVIDTSTQTLYCVAKTKEGSSYVQRLHALDIATGVEKFGAPVVISGSVPGTGDDSVGGIVNFNPLRHMNRPGLLLLNGVVYIAFGSHGDNRPYHGWVFGYNATTLQRTAIYNTTPNGWGGAIWQSGLGLTSDDAGNIYFETGNGSFDMNTGGKSCSSCFVKLSTPSLQIADWFAPYNVADYNAADYELGVTGPILLPGTTLIEGGAKDGIHYILDRNNLGHFQAGSNSQIVQSLQVTYGTHLHSAPVYWKSPDHGYLVYSWHEEDVLKAYNFVNGRYPNTVDPNSGLALPFATSTMGVPDGMPGGVLSVSANVSTPGTGIVWAATPFSGDASIAIVPGILRAFDASNVGIELWDSHQNLARDDFGNLAKYTPPTVANGKVYVATFSNQLAVYGLLSNGSAPSVTSVSPINGPTTGGTSITITGTGFSPGASVSAGGAAANGITIGAGGTTITATTGAHAAGTVAVTVMNADGRSGTLPSAFTYVPPAPVVNTVAPSTGSTSGGSVITITGTGFVAGATVTLDGNAATGVSVSGSTSITATTAAHAAGTVDVIVTNPDTQTGALRAGFTYVVPGPAPTVTNVTPATGATGGGTVVTISGTNFVSGSGVSLGGVPATGVSVGDAMTIVATTPPHAAGTVAVTITNPDGQQGTLPAGFSYVVVTPTVASVTPASGSTSGGTAITITGTNYVTGATVSVGGAAATGVNVASSTTITATTPAHAAGAVSVTVTNPNGQSGSKASAFAYLGPAPTISSVSPTSGTTTGGTTLTIRGTNFVAGAIVGVGGGLATAVTVNSSTRITATTPAHAFGVVDVTVTNPDTQVATRPGAFTFAAPAPTVSGVAPATGPVAGGTAITITGTNFLTGATVSVGGSAATGVSVAGSTTITATTPAHATGLVNVVVTNPDSQSATRTNAFTYTASPSITTVAPTGGPTAGGTIVTIIGTGFAAGATVSVGGTAATAVTVSDATSITATTPAHSAGLVNVVVTNPDTQSGTLTGAFTYAAPLTVTGVAPASGPSAGGTAVTITGTSFIAGATVTIGGSPAANVNVGGSTTITATTPAHAAGAVDVVVTNPNAQSATLANGFLYSSASTPISLVQHVSKDAGTASSSTLAFAAANTARNLIVVAVRAEHTNQVFTISDTRGNTYRNAALVNDTADGTTVAIFYSENIAAGANTVTVADNQSGTLRFTILEYTGAATVNSLDVAIAATGNGTAPNSGSVTTTVDGALVVGAISIAEAATFTPGAGFAIEELVPANAKLMVEDRRQTTAGQVSSSATISPSEIWVAIVATFKPGP